MAQGEPQLVSCLCWNEQIGCCHPKDGVRLGY